MGITINSGVIYFCIFRKVKYVVLVALLKFRIEDFFHISYSYSIFTGIRFWANYLLRHFYYQNITNLAIYWLKYQAKIMFKILYNIYNTLTSVPNPSEFSMTRNDTITYGGH